MCLLTQARSTWVAGTTEFPALPRDRAGAAELSPCRRNGGSSKLGKGRSTQKLQSDGWMMGSPRAGPGAAGAVPSCPGTWSGSAWSCHRGQGHSAHVWLGEKHCPEHFQQGLPEHKARGGAPGYAKSLGLLGSATGPNPVCQPLPFPMPKQHSFPRSPGWSSTGRDGACRGEGSSPHSPRPVAMSRPPSCLTGLCRTGKNQAQNVSQGEGEGKNKSKFLVDVFPWPSPDRLLQLSTAQYLFVCSTPPGHPEGLARDPPPAGHTRVVWSDWKSLGAKG